MTGIKSDSKHMVGHGHNLPPTQMMNTSNMVTDIQHLQKDILEKQKNQLSLPPSNPVDRFEKPEPQNLLTDKVLSPYFHVLKNHENMINQLMSDQGYGKEEFVTSTVQPTTTDKGYVTEEPESEQDDESDYDIDENTKYSDPNDNIDVHYEENVVLKTEGNANANIESDSKAQAQSNTPVYVEPQPDVWKNITPIKEKENVEDKDNLYSVYPDNVVENPMHDIPIGKVNTEDYNNYFDDTHNDIQIVKHKSPLNIIKNLFGGKSTKKIG